MTTTTPTLTDWLLARIAEDEAVARRVADAVDALSSEPRSDWYAIDGRLYVSGAISVETHPTLAVHIARHDPARVLAECKAKRQIVEQHLWLYNDLNAGPTCFTCWHRNGLEGPGVWPCPTLRALAAVYADHDGYQEEWR